MVDWALKIKDLFAGVPQLQEKQACFPASSSVTQPWSETSAASWPICEYNYELQHWTQTPSTGLWHTMILPSTTTIFSYVIGSWKLSANEQFFIGAQTVVSLLQTIQIKQGMSFIQIIAASAIVVPTKFTPAQIKPQSFESRWNSSSFLPGVVASHVYVGAWVLGCFHSHISTQTFWRALTVLVDSCAEIKSAPSVA